ncbi:MAG: hypothetical protein LBT26_03780 [Clostridiales Family XIII bacterium]|nr:hypothetical protein [Clostridiales Family XIII bacterium]
MVNKNILKKLNKLEKSNTSDNDAQRNTGFPNSMERARQEAAQRDEKTAEAIREMVHMLREIQSGQLSGGGRADAPQKTPEPNRNAPSGRQHYGNEQDLFNAHLKQSAQLTDSFKPASFVLASGGVHEDENANVKPFYKIDKGKEQFDVYPAAHCLNSRAERLRIEILFELPPNADSAPAMQLVRPCKLFKTSRGLYEIDQKGKLSL